MSGSLASIFVNDTLKVLEKRCLILLCESYLATRDGSKISIDCEEEDISKEIILSLKKNKKRIDWQIRVEPEHRLYDYQEISAKKSPRIDFCFSCWNVIEWEFYAEAKNLIEVDTNKTNRKTPVSANNLCKRYIKTGIDSYISTKYPQNGCMIGYILQGNINNIISSINTQLESLDRQSEILVNTSFDIDNLNSCYRSNHPNGLSIKHLMFDYSTYKVE